MKSQVLHKAWAPLQLFPSCAVILVVFLQCWWPTRICCGWDEITELLLRHFPLAAQGIAASLPPASTLWGAVQFLKPKDFNFCTATFTLRSSEPSPVFVGLPFLGFCTMSVPEIVLKRERPPKWTVRMSEQMLILLLHSISFYLQLYWHYILRSCKTCVISFSTLLLLYFNADWDLNSSY